MGINERKERDKQEMRKNIIDAAITMFVQDGYEKTSIRNIADKIEYSPATIYLYYKDKDELLYDVQSQAFDKLLANFKRMATSKDPLEKMEQACYAYVDFGLKNKELYDLMFIIKAPMNSLKDNEEWENGEDALTFFRNCVSDCIDKKLIRFTDTNMATLSIWAMAHGLISLDTCCRLRVTRMTDNMIDQFVVTASKEYLSLIRS